MRASWQGKSKNGRIYRNANGGEIGTKPSVLRAKLQRQPVAPDIWPRARLLDRLNKAKTAREGYKALLFYIFMLWSQLQRKWLRFLAIYVLFGWRRKKFGYDKAALGGRVVCNGGYAR